ncbi:MAG: ribonuclease D, partial [Microbacterium gubbeenense]
EFLSIPTENLLTPDHLRRVAWQPPEPLTEDAIGEALASHGARPWQIAQTAPIIRSAFVHAAQASDDTDESAS